MAGMSNIEAPGFVELVIWSMQQPGIDATRPTYTLPSMFGRPPRFFTRSFDTRPPSILNSSSLRKANSSLKSWKAEFIAPFLVPIPPTFAFSAPLTEPPRDMDGRSYRQPPVLYIDIQGCLTFPCFGSLPPRLRTPRSHSWRLREHRVHSKEQGRIKQRLDSIYDINQEISLRNQEGVASPFLNPPLRTTEYLGSTHFRSPAAEHRHLHATTQSSSRLWHGHRQPSTTTIRPPSSFRFLRLLHHMATHRDGRCVQDPAGTDRM
ncbi:hypothetical protein FPV67DRAFT_1456545 [Lyophyllum atratum]|nr:hypothetical protein FPV67DRAFT_1456545 [Lyophyllum atratum]